MLQLYLPCLSTVPDALEHAGIVSIVGLYLWLPLRTLFISVFLPDLLLHLIQVFGQKLPLFLTMLIETRPPYPPSLLLYTI